MSPSSPTLLLRNIEKQSAQLTQMVSSLINAIPVSLPPTSPDKPYGKMAAIGPHGASKLRKAGVSPRNRFCKQQLAHKPVYGINKSWQPVNYSSIGLRCDETQKPVLVKRDVCERDPSFHPVLSLPSDVLLRLHLEGLLKRNSDIKDPLKSRLFYPHDDDEDDDDNEHLPHGVCVCIFIKLWQKLRDHHIKTLSWAAQSPDLNPIENLWNVIKRMMDSHKSSNKELLLFLRQKQCESLVESMPRRMKAVIKDHGYSTKY
ncbi:unnamed protein product [Ranitomeya imitator]|uniref:Tc1-like transposase DDE domain-containing protein n=1 Tax=Ranitomeya imitator TaxID=111125 RepID=A0ABN9MIX7_9NEOB|nr:unnamed protein product [Ranitomeya imitator]